jgi:hypothetical protein
VLVFVRPGSQPLIVGGENADLFKASFCRTDSEISYDVPDEHAELVVLKYTVCRGQPQVRTRDMTDRVKFWPGSGLSVRIRKVRGAYRDDHLRKVKLIHKPIDKDSLCSQTEALDDDNQIQETQKAHRAVE